MQKLLAVILCGGESKRMGNDKGLLPIANTIWAKYIADQLASFNIDVVFSVNETQFEKYVNHISGDKLVVDAVNAKGPLKGLLSVYQQYPECDLLLMACDMLDIDVDTIEIIIDAYFTSSGYDFYVYQGAEYAQPFCGIYTAKALRLILLNVNTLTVFSMQHLLNNGNTKRLPVENLDAFKNYNKL